ncbi:MAG: hypothetical protein AB7V16_04330 [Vulcanibacillus sp.]
MKKIIEWFSKLGINSYQVKLILILSLIITLCTLFVPQKVYIHDELEDLGFGYPVHFVTQNLSKWDPPLPYYMNITLNPWEERIPILNPFNFLLSLSIVYAILFIIRVTSLLICRKIYGVSREEAE